LQKRGALVSESQAKEAARPEQNAAPDGLVAQKVKGLFSSQSVEKVGTGTTVRKAISKTYWFAEERGDGTIEVQPLSTSHVPSGPKSGLTKDEFLAKFSPEPEFYQKVVYPKLREVESTVQRAEEQRRKGAFYSAEFEYANALQIDIENVRANFGLGLTYMSRGDTVKAKDILGRIVKLDAAFAEEHKHLFNEFGISLRKTGMHEQAVEYYGRALEMSAEDENLHYNIARAYYEQNERDKCAEHLARALEINPAHAEAKKFLEFLKTGQTQPHA